MTETVGDSLNYQGSGYMILYNFKKQFLRERNLIPEFLKNNLTKGFGAIIYMDFSKSPLGACEYLFFIPGKFKIKAIKRATITKFYSSSVKENEKCINKLGLKKNLARFEMNTIKNSQEIRVYNKTDTIFKVSFGNTILPMPANKFLSSFNFTQKRNGYYYNVDFIAKAKGKMAIIKEMEVEDSKFPDTSSIAPFVSIKLESLKLKIPNVEIKKDF